MSDILVIAGHPDYKSSFSNRAILDEVHRVLPSADIVYLDAEYPDWNINVKREQDRLNKARTVIFEFPFWWFGSPSLIHRYVEQVFTYGYAYGTNGTALNGKNFILSFTAGASEKDYTPKGGEGFDMQAFMPPFLAMSGFCGMVFKGTVISYEMALLDREDEKMRETIMARVHDHAQRLTQLIKSTL